MKVENDLRICIVDAVAVDGDRWFIVENKTRSDGMSDDEARMLPAKIQVQMYHHSVKDIADELWLDPAGYQGIKYVMTKKPGERRKKSETKEEFGARLTSETSVVEIPKSCITGNPEPAMVQALAIASAAETAYKSGIENVPMNTEACFRYNSPCPHFSLCHQGEIHERNGRRILGQK